MFWHVAGVAVIIAILVFVPDHHQSVDFVFTERINNSGFGSSMYWCYVLPLGFLLTMYTITGYDASAHVSEETHERRDGRRAGHVAVGLLLGVDRLVRAAGDHVRGHGHEGRHERRRHDRRSSRAR